MDQNKHKRVILWVLWKALIEMFKDFWGNRKVIISTIIHSFIQMSTEYSLCIHEEKKRRWEEQKEKEEVNM